MGTYELFVGLESGRGAQLVDIALYLRQWFTVSQECTQHPLECYRPDLVELFQLSLCITITSILSANR